MEKMHKYYVSITLQIFRSFSQTYFEVLCNVVAAIFMDDITPFKP